MYRWYDSAKRAFLEFKNPEYIPYREKCRKIYADVKIDLEKMPYLCSRYPDRLVWLTDEELFLKYGNTGFEQLIAGTAWSPK